MFRRIIFFQPGPIISFASTNPSKKNRFACNQPAGTPQSG